MADEIPLILESSTVRDDSFWIAAANGAVRSECGWHVAPIITETLVLDGRGGSELLLPSLRVRSLGLVKTDGVDVTDLVRFSRRAGVLELDSGWSHKLGSIEVQLTHGFKLEEVPDLPGIIARIAARAKGPAGIATQSIGSARIGYALGRGGVPAGVELLESERDALAPYRLNWGS